MKLQKIFLMLLGIGLVACNKKTADFSFSPTNPKAGESVQMSNLSTDGDDWEWDFGDGTSSELKSPSKIYKRPGTYTITLTVDESKRMKVAKQIIVVDTIPQLTCSDTTITYFENVTFRVACYNPYSAQMTYEWSLPDVNNFTIVKGNATDSAITGYFTKPNQEYTISLRFGLEGKTYNLKTTLTVCDKAASALLMADNNDNHFIQRLYSSTQLEQPQALTDSASQALLAAAQDTLQTMDGQIYTCSSIKEIVKQEVDEFRIDSVARKIYFANSNGLFIANYNGSYIETIDVQGAFPCLDLENNRFFFFTPTGARTMALIQSPNNKFTSAPTELNALTNLNKLAFDARLR